MKKHLIMATGLAVLSTSAFATKARMQALGQSTSTGSFYLSDTTNVWGNAADLNNTKDYIVTEWGTPNFSGVADAETAPHGEGGFFKEIGNFAVGIYAGRRSENNAVRTGTDAVGGAYEFLTSHSTGADTTGESGFLNQGNGVDLFFAGDAGIQWGVHLAYSANKVEANATTSVAPVQTTFEKTTDTLGVDLGVIAGDINAWINMDLKDESTGGSTANDTWEADTGFDIGAGYALGNGMSATINFIKAGFTYTNGGTETTAGEKSQYELNFAKVWEMSSNGRVFTAVSYLREEKELTNKTSGGKTDKLEAQSFPATFGFETDANSWLTVRGSFGMDFGLLGLSYADITQGSSTIAGKTRNTKTTVTVNAGATLNFGKLKVDGVIGTEGRDNSTGAVTGTQDGVLALDNLMTRVAVHYWF